MLFTWTILLRSILDSIQGGSWKIDLIITRFYLEYILNFILFELIISVYCCYSLELLRSILDSWFEYTGWVVKNWSHYYTLLSRIYSQFYFIRINYICLLLLFTWTILFYSILDSNVQGGSWKIDLIITRFYLEYILNFILFELIISLYCCYLLELFSYVRFLIRIYRVVREKLISLFHALLEINLEYILNFILFRSTISR